MDEGNVVVIDNLVSTSRTDALSARQGKILNEKIVNIESIIDDVATDNDIDAIFTNNASN
jgi:hypothetical protein